MKYVETIDAQGRHMIPLEEEKPIVEVKEDAPVEVKEEIPVEEPVKEDKVVEEVPVKKTRAKKAKT